MEKIFVFICLLLLLLSCSENNLIGEIEEIPSNMVIGNITCSIAPTLSENEVIKIAKSYGLRVPGDKQFWKISYTSGTQWRTNPYKDECIWAVRHHTLVDGEDYLTIAGNIVYIRDSNGDISGELTSKHSFFY